MSVTVVCPNPQCAAKSSVPDEWLGRRTKCSRCGQRFSPQIRSGESKKEDTDLPTAFGRFQILEKLGSGAFGTVYKAYDPQLDREVALKVPHAGMLDSPKRVQRFLGEARAAARLRHPHIVPVFDAGPDGDGAYIAAAYIPGGPLASALAGGGLELRRAARLTRELAEALAYAHSEGIVHRDVKSANVLLDPHDHTHLTDFGLAIRLDQESRMTQDGTVLGTPSYMAPEQASGKLGEAGPASDQYSLGAVLYELLTGRTPFEGPPQVVLFHAVHTLPTSPQNLRPAVPKDLETICLKALAKQPDERYRDCQALADDLRRWLDGEPIAARPLGGVERLVRWSRRNPIIASLGAAVALSLLLGSVVSLYFAVRAANSAADARTKATEAANHAQIAETEKERAREEETNARAAERVAKLMTGQLALDRGLMLCEQGDVDSGMHWLARSLELLPADAADLRSVASRNLADWRWNLGQLRAVINVENGPARIGCTSDKLRFFTVGYAPTTRLWNLNDGTPAGPYLYADGVAPGLDFSPDGRHALLIANDKTARLWDTADNQQVGDSWPHGDEVMAGAFSPDGKTAWTGCRNGIAQRWDVDTGKPIGDPIQCTEPPIGFCFSSDGKRMAINQYSVVVSWDIESAKHVGEWINGRALAQSFVDSTKSGLLKHVGEWNNPRAVGMAFTPDNKHLLLAIAGGVQARDATTTKPVGPLLRFDARVTLVVPNPDGTQLLIGDLSGKVRLWEAENGVPTGRPLGSSWPLATHVRSGAFSPDGRTAIIGTGDNLVRMRDCPLDRPYRLLFRTAEPVRVLSISGDGKVYLTAGSDNSRVQCWKPNGKQLGPVITDPSPLAPATVRHWALSQDGRVLVSSHWHGVRFFARDTGKPIGPTIEEPKGGYFRSMLSPDQSTVATITARWNVICRDMRTGKPIGKPLGPAGPIRAMAYSPNSRFLAVGTEDGYAQIYEAMTGQAHGPKLRLPGPVEAFAFRPDGRTLLTACVNLHVTAWDVENLVADKPVGHLLQHPSTVTQLQFSRDAKTLLTRSIESGFQLWDLATGKPISAQIRDRIQGVTVVTLGPDGKSIITGHEDGSIQSRDLSATVTGSTERIRLWSETLSGTTMDAGGIIRPIDDKEWNGKRQRLTELGGPPLK